MSNRIQNAIDKMNIRLLNLSKDKIITLENSFNDIDDMELIEYQKTQALAFASNLLTLDEANQVYNILGREFPCVEKFNNRSLSEKIIITQLMKELMEKLYL